MIVTGLMILVSMVCMAMLVIGNVRMTNKIIEEERKRRENPWTWD